MDHGLHEHVVEVDPKPENVAVVATDLEVFRLLSRETLCSEPDFLGS
jgi:hypothetical protein